MDKAGLSDTTMAMITITVMITAMVTNNQPVDDLLALTQWLSPAFPVGSYAYSHGLDWFVSEGKITDSVGFAAWLDAILRFGSGRSDTILLSLAHRAAEPVELLGDTAGALAAGKERWTETWAQGRAFMLATNAILGTKHAAMPLPVAVGVQARSLYLPTSTVAALYLQAFASNLAIIAARIVPIGQTDAQRLLAGVQPLISTIAGESATSGLDDLASAVPGADLASLLHETQTVRLFLS
jgi:urease accessory protein